MLRIAWVIGSENRFRFGLKPNPNKGKILSTNSKEQSSSSWHICYGSKIVFVTWPARCAPERCESGMVFAIPVTQNRSKVNFHNAGTWRIDFVSKNFNQMLLLRHKKSSELRDAIFVYPLCREWFVLLRRTCGTLPSS